jgi:F-type H+-transporting ATPase subunit a
LVYELIGVVEANFEVKKIGHIIIACVILSAIFAVNLPAQTADTNTTDTTVSNLTNAVAAATVPAASDKAVPAAAPEVFNIMGLPVTNSMICTWIVAAFILIVVRVGTWNNIKEIPSGLQNLIEAIVEGWEGLIGDILDERVTRWVFPFATTFFIFIIISNLTDLIPGVGSIGVTRDGNFTPLFRPPTTDANLTVAMAGIFLVMSLYWALKFNGPWGLVKHIFGVKMETSKLLYPIFFLLFIFIGMMELLSVLFARPVALAMRLYGNVFAGESILDMIYQGKSLVFSLLLSSGMYFYETFVCVVQAFVFAMLVVAFVGTLCTQSEDHGH